MNKSRIIYIIFCLFLLLLIVFRYYSFQAEINQDREYGKFILSGKIITEPDVRDDNIKLTVKTDKGKALITVDRYPEYKYGDEIKITGEFQEPPVFDDFNYKNYLIKDRIYYVAYYPEVELLNRKESLLFNFKDKLRQNIYKAISPPQSSILGAMLLGDKNRMSSELREKLNVAGVRHITAVSGMHIVIIMSLMMSLLLALGFWRGQAFYATVLIIFLFVFLTGFQASGIRAFIMGFMLLLARKVGRRSSSSRSIVLTAGVMLAINPMLLFYDAGFQLSFLAVIGIISLFDSFKRLFKFMPHSLRDILAITFSAYVFTLPLLVYSFGRVSLVAPLTNILIVPVVYWIMILGLTFSLISLVWWSLAFVLSWPVWFLLSYIIKVVNLFSGSWAARTIDNVHWIWLVVFYLFLFIVVWSVKKRVEFFSV